MSAFVKLTAAVSSTLHTPWFNRDFVVVERRDLAILLREHEELKSRIAPEIAHEYVNGADIHR